MAAPLQSLNTTAACAATTDGHAVTPSSLGPTDQGNVIAVRQPTTVESAQSEDLAWWAEGLLKAVVAADTTDEGEPVLAAAGNAAAAALMLVHHHQRHDGDLREMFDVSADQLAIVRELLHTTATPAAAPAHGPTSTLTTSGNATTRSTTAHGGTTEPATLNQSAAGTHRVTGVATARSTGGRQRRRRLRLVRSR